MSKKETHKDEIQKPDYEHLRNELFDVRVDLKAWLSSVKVITISASIIVFILGFFGYSKIESIESKVFDQVNERLQVTDSLIASLDKSRIDSLNQLLNEQEQRYKETIKNLEESIRSSEKIRSNLIKSLPSNTRIEGNLDGYTRKSPDGLFTLTEIQKEFDLNESINVGLIFEESVSLEDIKSIYISVIKKDEDGSQVLVKRSFYQVAGNINKIPISFDFYRGSFELSIGFLEEGREYDLYYSKDFQINIR